MLKNIKYISPQAAYRINLGIYLFHVLVGIVTFFYAKFSTGLNNYQPSWSDVFRWLITPPYAIEFIVSIILSWDRNWRN